MNLRSVIGVILALTPMWLLIALFVIAGLWVQAVVVVGTLAVIGITLFGVYLYATGDE